MIYVVMVVLRGCHHLATAIRPCAGITPDQELVAEPGVAYDGSAVPGAARIPADRLRSGSLYIPAKRSC